MKFIASTMCLLPALTQPSPAMMATPALLMLVMVLACAFILQSFAMTIIPARMMLVTRASDVFIQIIPTSVMTTPFARQTMCAVEAFAQALPLFVMIIPCVLPIHVMRLMVVSLLQLTAMTKIHVLRMVAMPLPDVPITQFPAVILAHTSRNWQQLILKHLQRHLPRNIH